MAPLIPKNYRQTDKRDHMRFAKVIVIKSIFTSKMFGDKLRFLLRLLNFRGKCFFVIYNCF